MALFTAAIVAAGAIGGALIGSSASKSAASTQAEASYYAADLQQKQYEQTREDMAPWRETGEVALAELADLYGLPTEGRPAGEGTREERQTAAQDRFFTSPGYEFRLDEGIRAVERSASARGRLGSGATERELTRYGQGLASQEFGNYANRLSSLAGQGQTATAQTGAFGAQAAQTQGQYVADAGTARASGYTGSAEAITGGIRDLSYLGSRYGGGYGGGSSVQRPTAPDPNWGF